MSKLFFNSSMTHKNETHLAEQFLADVDILLGQRDRPKTETTTKKHTELMDLVGRLVDLDFSADRSDLRKQLRRDLMARYSHRQEQSHQWVWNHWPLQWRPTVVGLVIVLLCILVITLAPSTRTLAQEAWQTVLNRIQLIRILPQVTNDEGTSQLISIKSPAEAVPLIDFPIYVPSYLPQGYHFRFGTVSQVPQQSVSFIYGIPVGRIVLLPGGQAVSSRTFKGLHIYQMQSEIPGPWPIGEAAIEEVMVNGQPALWLTGLPMIQSEAKVTAKVIVNDNIVTEQETLSYQKTPPEVLAQTPVTALMWEEDDLLLAVLDLDGHYSLEEMSLVAEGLVPISSLPQEKVSTPTPRPIMDIQTSASLEEMVTEASFSPYLFNQLPQEWEIEKITVFSPSDNPLEKWYTIQYRNSQGGSIRLTEGLHVPLELWPNYIEENGGTLLHTTANSLEIWTSELYQETQKSMIKENARLKQHSIPNEVQAMFLRAPDGFSLELIAIEVPSEEILTLVETLSLAPNADPTLNNRLMEECCQK